MIERRKTFLARARHPGMQFCEGHETGRSSRARIVLRRAGKPRRSGA